MRAPLALLSAALCLFACQCSSDVASQDPCAGGTCPDPSVEPADASTHGTDAGADAAITVDAGACVPGAPCGPVGSGCVQRCAAAAACQPAAGPTDFATDPDHCGSCGASCPTPLHAARRCVKGKCGRAACEPGYFDLDGQPGCETRCQGTTCTPGDGGTVELTSPPVPESGLTFQTLSSASSHGELVQTSAGHTNVAVLGEPTPPPADGAALKSKSYRLQGGFTSMEHQ